MCGSRSSWRYWCSHTDCPTIPGADVRGQFGPRRRLRLVGLSSLCVLLICLSVCLTPTVSVTHNHRQDRCQDVKRNRIPALPHGYGHLSSERTEVNELDSRHFSHSQPSRSLGERGGVYARNISLTLGLSSCSSITQDTGERTGSDIQEEGTLRQESQTFCEQGSLDISRSLDISDLVRVINAMPGTRNMTRTRTLT